MTKPPSPDRASAPGFLDELRARGLFYQATADTALDAHLAQPGRAAYCGFDPTADSLTIGNFIQIKLLVHWQRAGHRPIVVMGGGTGLIGDPSGKDAERQLLDRDRVDANVQAQRRIYERLLDFDPAAPNAAVIVNNLDWLDRVSYLDMLRDVGKYFSVNAMIQKDSVRERLHNREQGISYTEFSYMLLQAYDFLHLYETMGCTVQTAGSDQFGNIVAGIDLIRRKHGGTGDHLAFGVTSPLVTRSDGKKIGKTEKGAIWLTADRTSPYQFYQYWMNVEDADVEPFLKWFTFVPVDEISDVVAQHEAAPHQREGQRRIAREMTTLLHGADALAQAETASQALFSGDVRGLDAATLGDVFADVPASDHAAAALEGDGAALVELLPQTSLASSKREAREFLANGAISVNGEKVAAERVLRTSDLLPGGLILLRRGKKAWHATRWA